MQNALSLKISVRLYCGDEIAIGPGKADLLDAIAAHGSISAAARALGMSYRRAWLLVDTMNRCWQAPLVATVPGSAHGGGATITQMGERVLAHYRGLQGQIGGLADCVDRAALAAVMRDAPKISQKA
jgi:molybdate transport system regulatory protein